MPAMKKMMLAGAAALALVAATQAQAEDAQQPPATEQGQPAATSDSGDAVQAPAQTEDSSGNAAKREKEDRDGRQGDSED